MASNDESRWATIAEQTRYEPETPFLETYVFQTESPAGQPTLETSTLQVETPFLTQYMGETPGNLEAETNGIKLSSNTLLFQVVTSFSTRFRQERVRFGPALDSAGFNPVRAVGIDH
jgi:hypothetical protein